MGTFSHFICVNKSVSSCSSNAKFRISQRHTSDGCPQTLTRFVFFAALACRLDFI